MFPPPMPFPVVEEPLRCGHVRKSWHLLLHTKQPVYPSAPTAAKVNDDVGRNHPCYPHLLHHWAFPIIERTWPPAETSSRCSSTCFVDIMHEPCGLIAVLCVRHESGHFKWDVASWWLEPIDPHIELILLSSVQFLDLLLGEDLCLIQKKSLLSVEQYSGFSK